MVDDNYLYINNGDSELEISKFSDSNIRLKGRYTKTFFERFLNLFSSKREAEFRLQFDAQELRDISEITKKLCLKELNNSKNLIFNIERTSGAAVMPTKAHPTDVGYDLYCPFEFSLGSYETKIIDFHIKIGLEPGWEAQVRNRSGIVVNYHTMIPIGVGTIDPDYRGTIMATFFNFGREPVTFKSGSRVAQLVIKKTEDVYLKEGKVNMDTDRGLGGFGSTGIS